jgi:acyl-CoA dehydrogenase
MSELSEMIAATAAKVFADASAADGFDATLWKKVEVAGLDRVLLPEDQGGAGEDFEAAVAVARAAGAAAASVPICETLVANWALAKAGLEVEEGPKALAIFRHSHFAGKASEAIAWQPIAVETLHVTDGAINRLSVTGETIASVAGEPLLLIHATEDGAAIACDPRRALALYATLVASSLSGAMQSINAMTFDYANTRKQFGRTLGAFQAIQHMAARMAEEAAATEAAVQVAARELSGSNPLWHAAVAKGRASEAAGKIAASAHQIHGAIGFTREYALHRYTRRLWAWRDSGGSEQYWYEQIGRAAQEAGRDGLWPGITAGLKL